MWLDKPLGALTDGDFDHATDEAARVNVAASTADRFSKRCAGLRQVCFQQGIVDQPPVDPRPRARTAAEHAGEISQPEIRRDVVRYATTITTTLRPTTGQGRVKAIRVLCDWLADHHPDVVRLDQLDRTRHIEPFLAWARTRPWRGSNGVGKTVGLTVFHHDVVDLRVFFEDIAEWGWPTAPTRRLFFLGDIPRMPDALPRALPPAVDRDLMAAVAGSTTASPASGSGCCRATGMRAGELLDLEVGCIVDFEARGSWLKVPVGKLGTERMVPLEPETVALFDEWIGTPRPSPAAPAPTRRPPRRLRVLRTRTTDRPTPPPRRPQAAVADAGLTDPPAQPLHVTLHQLRHTFGTSLVNAGMSLPALMALLGHVTPEMTLRYAKVASPTIRDAYDTAMAKVRGRRPLLRHPRRRHAPRSPPRSTGSTTRCSRPASLTASAHATRSPARAATPTSASNATTSFPTPNQVDVLERATRRRRGPARRCRSPRLDRRNRPTRPRRQRPRTTPPPPQPKARQ